MEKISEVIEKRKEKIEGLKSEINLYPNDFKATDTVSCIRNKIEEAPDSMNEDNPVFSIAGRMMAVNRFGKTTFIRVSDRTGQIQAYIRKDQIGDKAYDLFKQLDIGDFLGLKGGVFKTKTGEWTLLVNEFRLVCKTTRPLPEKFHGLKDPEKRYRQRYLDLMMNADVREIFIKRSLIIQAIREYFLKQEYLEVETPMMQPIPGGAEAEPFITHHNALGIDLFLRIAPELYLKRLVVGGFERVFEINRNFRNEGVSTLHNPEFTMLEFYQSYATYEDLMALTEKLIHYVAQSVNGSSTITYQDNTIELSRPWRRINLISALEGIDGFRPGLHKDKDGLIEFAASKGIKIAGKKSHKDMRIGKIVMKIFESLVEPQLIQPTFVTGYPVEVSPLSRRNDQDPSITDRFELFIAGTEIANGFSELNDPMEQKDRFLQQVADREAGDEEAHYMDKDYVEALEYGMPPTAGEGIGIDRLTMLLTNSKSIREVILFPHMKPKTKE